ncbi:YceH family protein [Azonexus sp.]|uniref:YceH family protein n=1 Tax=Azonexus sp. TaxID=1872668 RepID=UPI0035B1958A
MSAIPQLLSPVEARILGVLIEKEKTTPDVYPLSVNSLTAGCNQKTSRDPVMSLSEGEIQAALEELHSRLLVLETSGRVMRYAHNFGRSYQLPGGAVVLLAVLMLRGPQTVSELRANCDRLHRFADSSSVEGYLEELAARPEGAMAVRLPKQPGSREHRWAHLLCGELPAGPAALVETISQAGTLDLENRVARLEEEVAELRTMVARLLPPLA